MECAKQIYRISFFVTLVVMCRSKTKTKSWFCIRSLVLADNFSEHITDWIVKIKSTKRSKGANIEDSAVLYGK